MGGERYLPEWPVCINVADRSGDQHQPQIDGETRNERGERAGAGEPLLRRDDLRAAGQHEDAHSRDIERREARPIRQ